MSFTKSIIEIELARKESKSLKALVINASNEKEKVELVKAYNRSLGRFYRALEDAEIAKSELEEVRDNLLEELLEAKGAELDEIEKELDAVLAYIEVLDNAINEKSKALGDIFERANFRGNTLDTALKFRDIINRA
jgi:cbb3-type cytochrome oxidase cytochrome c subunit